jgi:hypothetical protein
MDKDGSGGFKAALARHGERFAQKAGEAWGRASHEVRKAREAAEPALRDAAEDIAASARIAKAKFQEAVEEGRRKARADEGRKERDSGEGPR